MTLMSGFEGMLGVLVSILFVGLTVHDFAGFSERYIGLQRLCFNLEVSITRRMTVLVSEQGGQY
jgi:hypothetical protein